VKLKLSTTDLVRPFARHRRLYAGQDLSSICRSVFFEGIRKTLADVASNIYLIDATRRLSVAALDEGTGRQ
jgi:hypothetical protein